MTGAFEWLTWLAEWVAQFVPHWTIVDTRHRAMKWTTVRVRDLARARWEPSAKLSILEPGFHVWWPLFSTFDMHVVKRQTVPIVSQVITTTDGKKIIASAVLTFDIFNLALAAGETWDTDDLIADIGATGLYDTLADKSYDEIRAMQGRRMSTALKNSVKDELKQFGVGALSFRLKTLAEAEVHRLVQSTAQEGELK